MNWQVWGREDDARGALWRTFLAEQRALLRELDELERALPTVEVPVLVLADPRDRLVPVQTARRLVQSLPDARLQLINGAGHQLPRRAAGAVADAIGAFLTAVDAEQLDCSSLRCARPEGSGTSGVNIEALPRRCRRCRW